ncbi:hypothetical protein Tco_0570028 [Tanacetum coccineum]
MIRFPVFSFRAQEWNTRQDKAVRFNQVLTPPEVYLQVEMSGPRKERLKKPPIDSSSTFVEVNSQSRLMRSSGWSGWCGYIDSKELNDVQVMVAGTA